MRFSRYIAHAKSESATDACIHKRLYDFVCIACLHATEKASLSRCNVHHLRVVLVHASLCTSNYLSKYNGDGEIRTLDPLLARQVLSQLSYTPIRIISYLIML